MAEVTWDIDLKPLELMSQHGNMSHVIYMCLNPLTRVQGILYERCVYFVHYERDDTF